MINLILYAQDVQTGIGKVTISGGDFGQEFVNKILWFVLGFASSIAVVLIISGGYTILMSQGNAAEVSKGRESIVQALMGLGLILGSVFIMKLLTFVLGLNSTGFF